jgi:hypothetical protein
MPGEGTLLVIAVCDDPALAAKLAKLANLQAVLAWAPELAGIDSVQMDEYNYDILVPWRGRWIIFGVT